MFWFIIFLGIFSISGFLYYRKRKRCQDVFKKLGIPGPDPDWLTGNIKDMKSSIPYENIYNWSNRYGKIYGYYEGPSPILVSSDLNFLQEIFIRNHSKFRARKKFPLTDKQHPNLFLATGDTWKRLRTIVNPTFTSAKLKEMAPGMNAKIDTLINKLDKACDEQKCFDIYKYYQGLTLEVIGHLAIGIDTDAQTNAGDKFLFYCKESFQRINKLRYLFLPATPLFTKFQTERRRDLMQLLLDAEDPEISNENSKEKTQTKVLSNQEAQGLGYLFLLAGYETTSTALAYVTYLLAKHPDIQAKLQAEIDQNIHDESNISYEDMQQLQYLDMVLSESLRMYTIASGVTNRYCMETCTINGYRIEEGMTIQADVWSVHKDPENWPEPENFDPDRFLPENKASRHPLAWLPFGLGPRNCVGLRFALMEAKLAVCRIMKKFSFESCEETPEKLKLTEAGTVTPKDGITIKLSRR